MTDERLPNNELLSAYFDGEATPDERADAERWLHASAEARRELEEIGQVSDLVRALPHQRLPEHFAAQVLARAEREMLLATPAAGTLTVPATRRRAQWFALGSLITTAALVLVITLLMGPPGAREEVADNELRPAGEPVTMSDSRAPQASREEHARAGRAGAAGEGTAAPADLPRPELPDLASSRNADRRELRSVIPAPAAPRPESAAPSPAAAREGLLADAPAAQPGGPVRDRVAMPADEADPRVGRLRQQLDENAPAAGARPNAAGPARPLDLANVQVGEIVKLAEQSENGVAVVEFTVVDANEAAGALQVLLVRNGDQPEALEERSDKADVSDEAVAESAAPAESPPLRLQARIESAGRGELLAMYVESTDQQRLSSALAELERRGVIERSRVATTVDPERVEIAGLSSPERDQPSPADQERRDGAASRVTLARAVAQTKAQFGGGRSATPDASSDRKRAASTRAAATAPEVQTESLDGARDLSAAPQVQLAQTAGRAGTFQLLFRTDEKSLEATAQNGGRGGAAGTRRFTEEAEARKLSSSDAADQRLAHSASRDRRVAHGPLRVIFVFRQTP